MITMCWKCNHDKEFTLMQILSGKPCKECKEAGK
jgi:hypothetical protein